MTVQIVYVNGFDQYATGQADAILDGITFGSGSGVSISSAQAASGNRSLYHAYNLGTYYCNINNPPLSGNACGIGCHQLPVSLTETSTTAENGIHFYSAGYASRILSVVPVQGGGIRAIGPTGINYNSAGGLVNAAAWFHVEIQLVVSTTVGYIKVWINDNDTPVINQTNINTGATNASVVRIGAISNPNDSMYTDNLYIYNCASGDARVGEKHAISVAVNGVTATNDFTANGAATTWESVDEANQDGNTTYASLAAATGSSIFELEALGAQYTNISAVVIGQVCLKTDAGPCTTRLGLVQGGSTTNGASKNPGLTYAFTSQDVFTVDPVSGVAFTNADIGTLKLKLERTA